VAVGAVIWMIMSGASGAGAPEAAMRALRSSVRDSGVAKDARWTRREVREVL
jgi:hypothetical protein